MKPVPTGRLVRTASGFDLVLTRELRAPIEDVWASVTDSPRTARWFGPWEGVGATGHTVKLQLVHEEGQPWTEIRIDACEPPHRLAISTVDDAGVWRMEAQLTESDGVTTLELVQHVERTDMIGGSGPGWEYYLDMLIASREGRPLPGFDDYYPAQQEYYDGLVEAATSS